MQHSFVNFVVVVTFNVILVFNMIYIPLLSKTFSTRKKAQSVRPNQTGIQRPPRSPWGPNMDILPVTCRLQLRCSKNAFYNLFFLNLQSLHILIRFSDVICILLDNGPFQADIHTCRYLIWACSLLEPTIFLELCVLGGHGQGKICFKAGLYTSLIYIIQNTYVGTSNISDHG